MELSSKARALILEFEGLDQPSRWPGGSSGITLGHGFDLGFESRADFLAAWSRNLSGGDMQALSAVIGLTGRAAAGTAARFPNIRVTLAMADDVFDRFTVPAALRQTAAAFPGVEKLPADAAGALVSLVFNRGPGMGGGDSRREMREIRRLVAAVACGSQGLRAGLIAIAAQFKSMKRLWPTLRGLRRRRDAEAALILTCLP